MQIALQRIRVSYIRIAVQSRSKPIGSLLPYMLLDAFHKSIIPLRRDYYFVKTPAAAGFGRAVLAVLQTGL
eukprot:6100726-Pyramimonas_sp.AAC.2